MPRTLVFRAEEGLFYEEQELAGIIANTGTYPRITTGQQSYDIARAGKVGWGFGLVDRDRSRAPLRFELARFGRGGTIVGADTTMRLRAKLWGNDWTVTEPESARIVVRPRVAITQVGTSADGRRIMRVDGTPPELVLELEDDSPACGERAAALTFACWLIVQWQVIPHVGASAG